MIFGENGLVNRTEEAKLKQSIAEAQERLELVLADAYAEKKVTQEYTEEEFLDEKLENFVYEQEPGANIFEYGDDELISLNGHAFYLDRSVPKLGDYAWPEGELPALITRIDVTNKTFTEISIDVKTVGAEESKYKYSIKEFEADDSTYEQVTEKDESTNTFTGLTSPKIYTIKVELIENNEVVDTKTINVKLGEIDELTLSFGKHSWSNGVASMPVTTTTSYQIEYQIGGIEEGSWKTIANGGTISNIPNDADVYARLSDGSNKTDYIYKKIVDDVAPTITRFEATETTWNSITVQVEAVDNESGLATSNTYKFYLNDEQTVKETNTTGTYSYTGLNGLTDYELRVEVYDNVGNKTERKISVTTKEAIADEVLDISDNQKIYVEIPNIKNPEETILCNVLYNDDTYGLQIISLDSVEDVTLGYDDPTTTGSDNFTKSMNSYNNAITTLNNKAMEYIESNNANYGLIKDIVEDARCVGSVPNDKNVQAGYFTKYSYVSSKYQLRDTDTNYETDYNQMGTLGIRNISYDYWLASRYVSSNSDISIFHVRYVATTGYFNDYVLCSVNSNGSPGGISKTYGFRPVFILNSNVKVTGGNGTAESPYTLGV